MPDPSDVPEPEILLAFTTDPQVEAVIGITEAELERMALEWTLGHVPPDIGLRTEDET